MHTQTRYWLALIAGSSLLLMPGCGDEKIVTKIQDPSIGVTVTAAPATALTGGTILVHATVADRANLGPLTFTWSASGGRFLSASAESTTWIAPDNAGSYPLSVVVTDGEKAGIGTANALVDTYLPTVTPFYRGASYCATCHDGGPGGEEYAAWSHSGHAGAIESLRAIGRGENPSCVGCHTVGAHGLNADVALNNGGFDETAVERLVGVQCENCHGAGSNHPDTEFTSVSATLDAAMCGQCHTDAHHPTFDEWQASGHAGVVEEAALRSSCAKCHNGLFAGQYLDNPEGFTNPTANPTESAPLACAICHDPHGNDNPGNLRNASVTDRVLPNAVLVENAGAGRLCMSCHNGRRTDTDVDRQINEGSGHLGPHRSVQGDMLAGVNAYERVNPDFPWASSKHILVEDACVTCHNHAHAGDIPNGIPNFTGHSFAPTVEACRPCHGELEDFDGVIAKQDFDGDGTIEAVQLEIAGLLAVLRQAIIDASATEEARAALEADFEIKVGDVTLTSADQRKAAYNWTFVAFDGSSGVHNTTYSVQLLQQSTLFVRPGALPSGAFILREAL